MVKFDIMKIRKVFPVEGFRYKIYVYFVYGPIEQVQYKRMEPLSPPRSPISNIAR
jgi:hypothetical protein